MDLRTDLALEIKESKGDNLEGVESEELQFGGTKITRITVTDANGEQALGRPKGTYITIETPPLTDDAGIDEELVSSVKNELSRLLPESGTILVVGLGNTNITPDALGPKTAERILATRHITGEIARSVGLGDLRGVAVLAPGVLGQTGIETAEIIAGIVSKIKPSAVMVIDALASRKLARLGCTVQIADSGICPGSGVGNSRAEISFSTLGIPVIAVGVPTVVDAATLAFDLIGESCDGEVSPRGEHMIVTPREIDILIDRASEMISSAMNIALQPNVSPEILSAII